MKKQVFKEYRFKDGQYSAMIDKETIFSPNEVSKVKPELVESYTLEKVWYEDDKDMIKAMNYLNNKWECWDDKKKLFIREIKEES